jgi:hypothetical protein
MFLLLYLTFYGIKMITKFKCSEGLETEFLELMPHNTRLHLIEVYKAMFKLTCMENKCSE